MSKNVTHTVEGDALTLDDLRGFVAETEDAPGSARLSGRLSITGKVRKLTIDYKDPE